jgi:hypothetical protein
MNNVLKDDEKLTNWELAMIDELDMILDCNYENLFDFTEEEKLDIVRDFLNNDYQVWEDINCILMNYVNEKLKDRLNYLRSLDNTTTLDPRSEEYRELSNLNAWERGEL